MKLQTIKPGGVLQFVLGCLIVSVVSTLSFSLGAHIPSVRGPSFSAGTIAALIGSGVALWFSVRSKDGRLALWGVFSLLPLAFWALAIYKVLHE